MKFKQKLDDGFTWNISGRRVFQAEGTARTKALKCLAYKKVSVVSKRGTRPRGWGEIVGDEVR